MKKSLVLFLLWIFLVPLGMPLQASSSKKRPPDNAPKTVKVKAYTKKNGKTVKAHNRRAPKD